LEHLATSVSAISGVLAARGKQVDLFGVVVLALVTGVGGGTLRDLILDIPVFWIKDPTYVATILITAGLTFVVARFWPAPESALLVADAGGLALFTIIGVERTFEQPGASPLVAAMLGVMTGVAGGILRDVILRQVPLVFRRSVYWYATASLIGAVYFVALRDVLAPGPLRLSAIALIFIVRLLSIWWRLYLPDFEAAGENRGSGSSESDREANA